MTESRYVLDQLRTWFADNNLALTASGYQLELTESPSDRNKQSVSVMIASDRRIAQLVVWDTGEAELSMGDVSSGNVEEEHREITSSIGLLDATQTMIGWVGASK
jgi:hypothetical protein